MERDTYAFMGSDSEILDKRQTVDESWHEPSQDQIKSSSLLDAKDPIEINISVDYEETKQGSQQEGAESNSIVVNHRKDDKDAGSSSDHGKQMQALKKKKRSSTRQTSVKPRDSSTQERQEESKNPMSSDLIKQLMKQVQALTRENKNLNEQVVEMRENMSNSVYNSSQGGNGGGGGAKSQASQRENERLSFDSNILSGPGSVALGRGLNSTKNHNKKDSRKKLSSLLPNYKSPLINTKESLDSESAKSYEQDSGLKQKPNQSRALSRGGDSSEPPLLGNFTDDSSYIDSSMHMRRPKTSKGQSQSSFFANKSANSNRDDKDNGNGRKTTDVGSKNKLRDGIHQRKPNRSNSNEIHAHDRHRKPLRSDSSRRGKEMVYQSSEESLGTGQINLPNKTQGVSSISTSLNQERLLELAIKKKLQKERKSREDETKGQPSQNNNRAKPSNSPVGRDPSSQHYSKNYLIPAQDIIDEEDVVYTDESKKSGGTSEEDKLRPITEERSYRTDNSFVNQMERGEMGANQSERGAKTPTKEDVSAREKVAGFDSGNDQQLQSLITNKTMPQGDQGKRRRRERIDKSPAPIIPQTSKIKQKMAKSYQSRHDNKVPPPKKPKDQKNHSRNKSYQEHNQREESKSRAQQNSSINPSLLGQIYQGALSFINIKGKNAQSEKDDAKNNVSQSEKTPNQPCQSYNQGEVSNAKELRREVPRMLARPQGDINEETKKVHSLDPEKAKKKRKRSGSSKHGKQHFNQIVMSEAMRLASMDRNDVDESEETKQGPSDERCSVKIDYRGTFMPTNDIN